MKILALDTTTDACSCALFCDGDIQALFELAPQQHAKLLLPMVEELIQSAGITIADLDAIAYARGPGSFTGIRIGISMAQGLALAHGISLVGISSLHALAWRAQRISGAKNILSLIDARMREVYWAQFENNAALQCTSQEQVTSPGNINLTHTQALHLIGSGADNYQSELKALFPNATFLPGEPVHAQDIVSIVAENFEHLEKTNPEQAIPIYIRDKVADKKNERKDG